MTATLLLQTTRWRDVTDDAALVATAEALDPIQVLAATTEPERTERATGIRTLPAQPLALLRALPLVQSVVVLGGAPLSSRAAESHLFSLGELYALLSTFNATGRRIALVGVGADVLTTGRDALYARRLVRKSSFTVVNNASSVHHLITAGVPSPLRVAAELAWLQLQDPPQPVASGDQVWCPLTRLDIEAFGGVVASAEALAGIQAAVAAQAGTDTSVTVQAWRRGLLAGDDIEAAQDVVAALTARRVRAQVAAPPLDLVDERKVLSSAQLCVCADPHTLMTAAASGAPLLAWPHDSASAATASQLGLPVLTEDPDSCVSTAFASPGSTLSSVRQAIAVAGETADLLKVLLHQGSGLPRYRGAPLPEQFNGLRPTGVMK